MADLNEHVYQWLRMVQEHIFDEYAPTEARKTALIKINEAYIALQNARKKEEGESEWPSLTAP